ncbi:MAG: exodeoxyribonuclease VII small subunit [Clostridia bacterium]|nr:exodeoxyribonuclease VII small subunit [Clostridia bacterium]
MFEDSMKKLEELSEKIRDEETSLDDAMKCYEEGISEYNKLKEIIENKKQRIVEYEK